MGGEVGDLDHLVVYVNGGDIEQQVDKLPIIDQCY